MVSWYDGDNLGLSKEPLLPLAKNVYSNFQGRVFRVPVFHVSLEIRLFFSNSFLFILNKQKQSPPWFWVNYDNESYGNTSWDYNAAEENFLNEDFVEFKEANVTGGRDHRLLQLLAKHMNFDFIYIEAPGRTQGSLRNDNEDNDTFTGGIGLLQMGVSSKAFQK